MDLIEGNKDDRKAQSTAPDADYVPLHPLPRCWEVPREGKGALGQVAKGTAVGLRGSPETTTVATKMLKSELLNCRLNDSLGLYSFRKCYRFTVIFSTICHVITYVAISTFRILLPLTKFYSAGLPEKDPRIKRHLQQRPRYQTTH